MSWLILIRIAPEHRREIVSLLAECGSPPGFPEGLVKIMEKNQNAGT